MKSTIYRLGLWLVTGGLLAVLLPYGMAQSNTESTTSSYQLSVASGKTVKQGSIVIVQFKTQEPTLSSGVEARFDGRKGRFFQQSPGVYEALFGVSVDTKPGPHTVSVLDSSGQPIAKETVTVVDGKFRRQNISVSKSTAGLKPIPGELEAIQALKENVSATRYWEKPFISPTPDCENSPFGVKRYHNGVYTKDYHKGVDLRSPHGRPIKAINSGVVKIATSQFRLHGGTVGLDHGQGLNSVYIHMSKVAVKEGDVVKKGDIIGYVGSTGFATGPHLHWGLYANGVPVNPDLWIPVSRC